MGWKEIIAERLGRKPRGVGHVVVDDNTVELGVKRHVAAAGVTKHRGVDYELVEKQPEPGWREPTPLSFPRHRGPNYEEIPQP